MATFATYRPHARGLLLLGLPLIGSHLAQIVIGITDALMLGWYAPEALAAATLGHSLWFVLFIVGSGFAFAVLPIVTSAMAAGESTQVRRVTRMGMWLTTIYGAIVMIPLIWAEPILRAIGQEAETAALAEQYLADHRLWHGARADCHGAKKLPFGAGTHAAGVVDHHWHGGGECRGELPADLRQLRISQSWAFAGRRLHRYRCIWRGWRRFCLYAARVTPEHALFTRLWRSDWEAFARVFRLGWPIGLTHLGEAGLFSASAVMMGWLGVLPLAAHGIVIQLASMTFVIHLGLSQAATVRAGAAATRKDMAGLRDGARTAIALSFAIAVLTVVLFLSMPEVLVSAFMDPEDPARPDILRIGVGILTMAALFQVVDGLQVVMLGLLRGLQDTRVPMVFATISYWLLGLPASYLFGFVLDLGAKGVWLGLVVGLAAAAVSLFLRFWSQVGRAGLTAEA